MYQPATIGAIDAGTNAIRVVVAKAESPNRVVRIHKERWPVRLGHNVFTRQGFDERTLEQAAEAFCHFAELFERFEVEAYRAVATSATREADNRDHLLRRIQREAGINLEVIDGREEARLTRRAVFHELGDEHRPDLIVDIGGGSLEINVLEGTEAVDAVSLPIGTVRSMETFDIDGAIDEEGVEMLRRHVRAMLRENFGQGESLPGSGAVGCGGNVESLAEIDSFEGDDLYDFLTLDLDRLHDNLSEVTRLGIRERMANFGVRRDRAEVMAIAGVVLSTLGQTLGIPRLSAPDVGVREGTLLELAERVFSAQEEPEEEEHRSNLLSSCRDFARRFRRTSRHTEQVRRVAARIFEELAGEHGMDPSMKLVLESAALLHEIGYAVSRSGRHKHAAYLIRNGTVHGLHGRLRELVACVVRHHRKSFPAPRHDIWSSLDDEDQPKARMLAGILRIADGLDTDFNQVVEDLTVDVDGEHAHFNLSMERASELPGLGARQKGHLFEVAFGLKPSFVIA
jgi:exopolyphosphatase/guanosine-5'-triphosphate,3'-diphosphate pyrophosphatase